MPDPFVAIAEYMSQRSWAFFYLPLLERDPDQAVEEALSELADQDPSMRLVRLRESFAAADCPLCATAHLEVPADPVAATQRMNAFCVLWNHTPRGELGGLTPVQHLRSRLAQRPDEAPWKVAQEHDDKIVEYHGPEFFRGLPKPEEFGLSLEVDDDPVGPRGPVENGAAQRAHPKMSRNTMCPCGSGKKFKKCCLRDS